MESGGELLQVEVEEAQVVQDLPVERGQVVGALQAGDGGNQLALAEKTHA